MRKGYSRRTIADLCHFISGNGFTPSDWKTSGLPIIRIQNLNGTTSFNYYDGPTKPEWLVEPGDLLYAWAGVKGVSFGPTIWSGPRGVLNQHIYRVVPRADIDRYWLHLVLKHTTAKIESHAHGFKSSLVHVHKEDITGQVIDVPPIEEQQKIAGLVRTWDVAIDAENGLIGRLVERRGALSQRLLSHFTRNSKLARLKDVLTESRIAGSDGRAAKKITIKLYGKGAVEKDESRAGSKNTRYYLRKRGQLIYSKLDFLNGAIAIIPDSLDGFETTLDLPAFDISPAVNPLWLLEYLVRPFFYTNQVRLARGQRKARRVTPEDLLECRLSLPERNQQDDVVNLLSAADHEIALTRELLGAMERQKRGLMQKLLTGQWRVKAGGGAL